jgi:hypothetical protein
MTAVQTPNVIAVLPPWAATLVWILAIAGAVVFVYRRITGATKPKPTDGVDEVDGAASTTAEPAPGVPSAFFVDPTTQRPGIPLTSPPADTEPSATTPPDSPGVTDLTEPAATASGRAGYFAAGGPADDADPVTGPKRLTVAEALRGIDMPSGLSPVIDGSVSIPNPFRVAFLTTSADAATVGAGLGDELERLGYQLTTATATEVLARKPGVELRVVLYPTPEKATRGLDQLFPVAPPGSVGVEFST